MRVTRSTRQFIAHVGRVGLVLASIFFNRIPLSAAGDQSSSVTKLIVLESSQDSIVVELTVGNLDIERVEQGGETYHRVQIPQMEQTITPGAPQVPTLGALLGLPTTLGVSIEVVEASHESIVGYRLHPAPQLSLSDTDLTSFAGGEVIESFALDTELYATGAFYPGEIVQLGGVGYGREQAVAQVQFYPVQYNPVRSELQIYHRIVARITWDTIATQATTAAAREVSPAYEEVLRKTLINYDLMQRPIASAAGGITVDNTATVGDSAASTSLYLPVILEQETTRNQTGLKIGVTEDGLYKLTYTDLLNAGLGLDGVDPQTIQIHNRGEEISIYVQGEADGSFDPDDFILFYATGMHDAYTTENVYWLSVGDEAGLRMALHNGTPSGTAAVFTNFPVQHHAEQDTVYWQSMPGYGEDRWFWESRISPSTANLPKAREYKVTLGQIALDATTAVIRVRLKGYTSLSHHTRLYLNDQAVDDWAWKGQVQVDHEVSVSHALLQSGENKVRIEAVETGAIVDQILLNWIEIEYSNRYVAEQDQLLFGAQASGLQHFTVSGFTDAEVNVFSVTNPAHPVQIVNARVSPDGEHFKLDFEDNTLSSSKYLALTPAHYKSPASIALDEPSNWKSSSNGADYIIITHKEFYDSALRLAQHRSASGLRVATVKIDDIYDEFDDGIFHPKAIRDFLQYAYQNWTAPAPTYVLLLGDANQDYKDNLKSGTPTYVPSYNIESSLFGEVSSDNWFVAVSGDDPLPDMVVGRLSAQDRHTAETIVTKVIQYDQLPPESSWNNHVLLVADDDESSFRATSEQLAARLPHYYTVNKVYAADYPPGNPSTDILNHVRDGTVLVNYTGHGEYFGWGKWNGEKDFLLQQSDVDLLSNAGKLPVITVGNCLNGFFAGPKDNPALAETFQRQESGGAIAVWAPTGFGYTSGHRLLLNTFYEAIFVDDHLAVGAATTAAKLATYAQSSFWGELIETYVLFGDPATRLGIPTNFPYIRQTTPANSTTDIAVDQSLQVVFSKPMNPDTVTLSSNIATLTFTPVWNADFTVVDYSHSSFEYGRTYELSLSGQDRNGIDLSTGTAPNPWSLTATTDSVPPGVTVTVPGQDLLSVLTTSPIEIMFSEPVRATSVTYSIEPFVPGLLQWDSDGRRATFTHNRFQVGQTYTYSVLTATDTGGNPLPAPVELTFTVGNTTYTHLPHIGEEN